MTAVVSLSSVQSRGGIPWALLERYYDDLAFEVKVITDNHIIIKGDNPTPDKSLISHWAIHNYVVDFTQTNTGVFYLIHL